MGPENTLPAFDRGMSAGADGLEMDVRLSADGVVVVHHDPTLDRTTSASGNVALRTAAELARVDAGYWFRNGDGFPFREQGIGIPTLSEVLRRYPGARIIVEMKVDSVEMGEALAREVRRAGAADRVCAAGYGARCTAAARAALPDMAFSANFREVRLASYRTWARWPMRTVPYGGYQVPELSAGRRIVSPRFVKYAHEAGLKVQVWTVDEEADMRRLLGWGVDGLISDRPADAVRVRDSVAGAKPS